MKYIGIVFAVLGICVHLRMLGWVLDPFRWQMFTMQSENAPLAVRAAWVTTRTIPFAFYGMCIAGCLVQHRSARFSIVFVVTGLLAILYFQDLHHTQPTVAHGGFLTAMFSYSVYFAKQRKSPEAPQAE